MKDCTFIHEDEPERTFIHEDEPKRTVVRSESPSSPRSATVPLQPKSEQHERPRVRQPMPPTQPPPQPKSEQHERPRLRQAVPPVPPKLRSEVAAAKTKGGASRAQPELRSSEEAPPKKMPYTRRLRSPEPNRPPPRATKTKGCPPHERGRSPEVSAAKPKGCVPRSRSPGRRFSTETVLGSRVKHQDFDAVCVLASQTGPFVWVGGMHGGSNLSPVILDNMHVQYVVPCKNFKGRVSLDSDRHHWMQGADMLFDHAKPELCFLKTALSCSGT